MMISKVCVGHFNVSQFFEFVFLSGFPFMCKKSSDGPNVRHLSSVTRKILHGDSFVLQRFWTGSGIKKNKAMVENLQHHGVIRSKKVSEVMEAIDRALFVPEGTPPYVDSPMQIGYNATISAPHMHAACLQLLEENLKPGMQALDVGSGTLLL